MQEKERERVIGVYNNNKLCCAIIMVKRDLGEM